MTDNEIKFRFYSDFTSSSKKEWEEKATADLKGRSFDKLIWKSFEGFDIQPFYMADDLTDKEYMNLRPGDFPFRRGSKISDNNWLIRQNFILDDNLDHNWLRFAVKSGVSEIGLIIPQGKTVSKKDLDSLVDSVDLNKIRISFKSDNYSFDLIKTFVEVLSDKKIDPNNVSGSFDFDPLGQLLENNQFLFSEEEDFQHAAKILTYRNENLPGFKVLSMGGDYLANSGAFLSQELGFTLAMGAENLAQLSNAGFEIDNISSSLQMTLGIGSDYFMEIAKIRAARQLWATIGHAFKPDLKNSGKIFIHSAPTLWNKTKLDPYVNMLRFTTEALSAAIGGADSISNFPFNMVSKLPGSFSERIARNTQIILKEESYINRIADPAAGSYYIENLTDLVANQAWETFREIENLGGFIAACKKGFIQDQLNESQLKRKDSLAERKAILVGTNNYPNLNEPDEECSNKLIDQVQNRARGAFEFEELRNKIVKTGNKKPVAVLFPYGDAVMRTARTIFATNFLGVGGFEIKDLTGLNSMEEGIDICNNENPSIIVCCSSDPEYLEFLSHLNKKLESKPIIIVAGYPADSIEELKKLGVGFFVHIKTNVFETLTDILNTLSNK